MLEKSIIENEISEELFFQKIEFLKNKLSDKKINADTLYLLANIYDSRMDNFLEVYYKVIRKKMTDKPVADEIVYSMKLIRSYVKDHEDARTYLLPKDIKNANNSNDIIDLSFSDCCLNDGAICCEIL